MAARRSPGATGLSESHSAAVPQLPDAPAADSASPAATEGDVLTQRVFGNVLSLAGGAIAARAVAFVGTAFVARQLGPAAFGIIGFATAICGYLSIAVSAGFNDVGAREIARRPAEAAAIAGGVTVVRVLLATAAFLLTIAAALVLPKPAIVKLVVVVTGLSFFALALDTSWVYKGLERTRRVAAAQIIGQLLFVAAVLAVVRTPDHVVAVPVAQFAGELIAAVLLGIPLVAMARSGRVRLQLREGWRILRSSAIWAVSRLLRTLIFTFAVVLLGVMLGEWEVGIYTAAYRVCFLLLAISYATQNSYLPAFTRASGEAPERLTEVATRSLQLALTLALPLVVGGILVAGPLLGTLFGAEYVEGTLAFQLLLVSIGLIFVNSTIHNVLLVRDRLKQEMRIIAFAAAANVVANVILIPRYGIVGAATATVLAELIIVVLGFVAIRRLGVRPRLAGLGRPVIAAAGMAAALLALGADSRLFLATGLGAMLYGGGLLWLRGVPHDMRPHVERWIALASPRRRPSG
jgi:O-antigen/teichoic acid export membrane protein